MKKTAMLRAAAGAAGGGGAVATPDAWYDFSDISTLWKNDTRTTPVTTTGDNILGVTDLGATGDHHLDSSLPPQYITGVQNSLSIARFIDATDFLRDQDAISEAEPGTWVFVAAVTDVAQGSKPLLADSQGHCIGIQTTGPKYRVAHDASTFRTIDDITADTDFHVFSVVWDGASTKVWVDGVLGTLSAAVAGASSMGGMYPGNYAVASFCKCDFGEIRVFYSGLTDPERGAVEDELATKWGL
jgi:hypothetical protein